MLLDLLSRVKELENKDKENFGSIQGYVQSEFKRMFKSTLQTIPQNGLYTALCVQTLDPLNLNRVQYYNPLYCHPDDIVENMPWANAVSSMGGFDDCGLNWVPPAGSQIVMFYERGDVDAAFYIGTTWNRDRGPDGNECNGQPHNFSFPIKEYECQHEGHRKGYLVGPNDGSQVYPQWTSENQNKYDHDSNKNFIEDEQAANRATWPNIYGFKTPEKHMFKMVDGNAKCNRRYKRLEIMSGTGNWMMFKDDHLRPCGEWSHTKGTAPTRFVPKCNEEGLETRASTSETCGDSDFDKSLCATSTDPFNDCGKPIPPLGDCGPRTHKSIVDKLNKGTNPYYRHSNECRPYSGPGTNQNNKCALPQSGIQWQTISGHTWCGDDSVEEPMGCPGWERSKKAFDYGVTDIYLGRTFWQSAHGHIIELSDQETKTNWRNENNYIRLQTATGIRFELNDHTIPGQCLAGPFRGAIIQTSSNHTLEMMDDGNEQCSPPRAGWTPGTHNDYPASSEDETTRESVLSTNEPKQGGIPAPKANRAFVKIRTGYGLEMMFADYFTQEQEVQEQFIQIFAPQYGEDCGPHIMRFQELPGGGQIFLRAGGNYIISTCKDMVTMVGEPENPANRFTIVSDNYIIDVKEMYYNHADQHLFLAEQYIFLLAGRDCEDESGVETPCVFPVVVGKDMVPNPLFPFLLHPTEGSLSDRVFASA